jgi:hypothetical protein
MVRSVARAEESNCAIFPFFLLSTPSSLTKVILYHLSSRLPAKAVLRFLLPPELLSLSLPAEAATFSYNPSPSGSSIYLSSSRVIVANSIYLYKHSSHLTPMLPPYQLCPRGANSNGTSNSNFSDGAIIIIVLVASGFAALIDFSITRYHRRRRGLAAVRRSYRMRIWTTANIGLPCDELRVDGRRS